MEYVLCMNCLKPKVSDRCPHCGKTEWDLSNYSDRLPVYARLREGRYIVGIDRTRGFGEEHGFSYRGWDSQLQRPVIIKEVAEILECGSRDEALRTGDFCCHWECVWNTQKRFDFPGFPRIYDVFWHDDVTGVKWGHTVYCIQEYIEGISLEQYMKNLGSELNAAATVRFLLPLMKDLARAHNAGLFHKNITAENVAVTPQGRARFYDLFAAQNYGNYDIPLPSATSPYTYGFNQEMLPQENYQREDIWMMAALFVQCLTGQRVDPYQKDKLPEWIRCDPVFTLPMRRVVERALSADPDVQYLTMAEFYTDLARCIG